MRVSPGRQQGLLISLPFTPAGTGEIHRDFPDARHRSRDGFVSWSQAYLPPPEGVLDRERCSDRP